MSRYHPQPAGGGSGVGSSAPGAELALRPASAAQLPQGSSAGSGAFGSAIELPPQDAGAVVVPLQPLPLVADHNFADGASFV